MSDKPRLSKDTGKETPKKDSRSRDLLNRRPLTATKQGETFKNTRRIDHTDTTQRNTSFPTDDKIRTILQRGDTIGRDLQEAQRYGKEFVEVDKILKKLEDTPCVTCFGAATPFESKHYEQGVALGRSLAENGYGVITGGGPGMMEAANRGAQEGGGISVAFGIAKASHEQTQNPYLDMCYVCEDFAARKHGLIKGATSGVVVFPGGFGTMDELFETLTKVQTEHVKPVPILLMGDKFWDKGKDWIGSMIRDDLLVARYMYRLNLDDTDGMLRILRNHAQQHNEAL